MIKPRCSSAVAWVNSSASRLRRCAADPAPVVLASASNGSSTACTVSSGTAVSGTSSCKRSQRGPADPEPALPGLPGQETDDEAELAGICGGTQQRANDCTLAFRDRVDATPTELATTSPSSILVPFRGERVSVRAGHAQDV